MMGLISKFTAFFVDETSENNNHKEKSKSRKSKKNKKSTSFYFFTTIVVLILIYVIQSYIIPDSVLQGKFFLLYKFMIDITIALITSVIMSVIYASNERKILSKNTRKLISIKLVTAIALINIFGVLILTFSGFGKDIISASNIDLGLSTLLVAISLPFFYLAIYLGLGFRSKA